MERGFNLLFVRLSVASRHSDAYQRAAIRLYDTSSHGRRGAVAVGVTEGYLDHCGQWSYVGITLN